MRKQIHMLPVSLTVCLIFFFSAANASAKTVVFEKEYTYQASELDSKISSRTIALELVKRLLLEEIGTYLESETITSNYQLSKDEIKIITAGIVKTKIISERWDGKTYRLKVEMKANPDEVEQSVRNLKERMELTQGAIDIDQQVKASLNEIEKLQTKAKTITSIEARREIKEKYSKHITILNEGDIIAMALIAHDSGRYDDAIALAKPLVGKKNTPWYIYVLLGSSYNQQKKPDQALSMLQQALKMSPKNPHVFEETARTFMLKGEPYNAISDFKKALVWLYEDKKKLDQEIFEQHTTENELLKRRKADVDRDIARIDWGIIVCSISIAADEYTRTTLAPSNDDEVNITGEAKIMIDAAVKEILLLQPDLPDYPFQILKFVNFDYESNKEMISWCDKLITLYPNNGGLYSIRGKFYFRLAQNDKNNYQEYVQQCFKEMEKAIELSPKNAEMYVDRAMYYSLLGKSEQGIKDLDVAIAMEPNNAKSYERRAVQYGMLSIYSLAIKNADKAIELNPLMASSYYVRGYSYIQTGNDKQGVNDLKVAARLGDKNARELLEKRNIQW